MCFVCALPTPLPGRPAHLPARACTRVRARASCVPPPCACMCTCAAPAGVGGGAVPAVQRAARVSPDEAGARAQAGAGLAVCGRVLRGVRIRLGRPLWAKRKEGERKGRGRTLHSLAAPQHVSTACRPEAVHMPHTRRVRAARARRSLALWSSRTWSAPPPCTRRCRWAGAAVQCAPRWVHARRCCCCKGPSVWCSVQRRTSRHYTAAKQSLTAWHASRVVLQAGVLLNLMYCTRSTPGRAAAS